MTISDTQTHTHTDTHTLTHTPHTTHTNTEGFLFLYNKCAKLTGAIWQICAQRGKTMTKQSGKSVESFGI